MNILVISDNYVPLLVDKVLGGAERVLMNINKALVNDDYNKITIIAPADSKVGPEYGFMSNGDYSKQFYFDRELTPPRNLNALTNSTIDYALEQGDFDLILNHHKQPSVINHLANNVVKLGIPIISWIHNAPIFGMLSVNTNNAYANLKDAGGLNLAVSGWCMKVNNGGERECVNDVLISQIADKRLTAVMPEFNNLTLGRFVNIKNIHIGMDVAISQLDSPTGGRVIGYSENKNDPYYITTIKAREDRLREAGRLYQGITYSETMDLMSKTGVFIQTSHVETSSCTQFEAAQRGVPQVIVVKKPGYHGSLEYSFMEGLTDFYKEVNTFRRQSSSIPSLLTTAIEELNDVAYNLNKRQELADYIYDNYNEKKFLARFYNKLDYFYKIS